MSPVKETQSLPREEVLPQVQAELPRHQFLPVKKLLKILKTVIIAESFNLEKISMTIESILWLNLS